MFLMRVWIGACVIVRGWGRIGAGIGIMIWFRGAFSFCIWWSFIAFFGGISGVHPDKRSWRLYAVSIRRSESEARDTFDFDGTWSAGRCSACCSASRIFEVAGRDALL